VTGKLFVALVLFVGELLAYGEVRFVSGKGARITLTYKVGGINPEGFAELAPIVDRVQAQQLGGLAEFLSAAAR